MVTNLEETKEAKCNVICHVFIGREKWGVCGCSPYFSICSNGYSFKLP